MDQVMPYESMFILNAILSKEDTDKLIDKFQALLTGLAAEISKVERLGKRKMAYEVKGQEEGFYVLFNFRSKTAAVNELERQFRFSDQVLKFQTLKVLPLRPLKVKIKKPRAAAAAVPAAS